MSEKVLASLQKLQPSSNRRLPASIITGLTLSLTHARYELIRTSHESAAGGYVTRPTYGTDSLLDKKNLQSIKKIKTLSEVTEDSFTNTLNTELLGGEQYPVLLAVLGTAAGVASFGGGLVFTIATTAMSLAVTVQRVLGRMGDEIWQIEEIGKDTSTGFFGGSSTKAVHVGSYFLVDPYRAPGAVRTKGWLIHEERHDLTL